MADGRLIEYIKNQIKAGYPISAINHVLLQSGYQQTVINEAIKEIQGLNSSTSFGEPLKNSTNSRKFSSKTIVFAIIGILLIVGGYVLISSLSSKSEFEETEPAHNLSNESLNNTSLTTPSLIENTIIPDIWINPPSNNASNESPILLPENSFEVSKNKSVAISFKIHITDYISSVSPSITCDQISSEDIITYPYLGNMTVGKNVVASFVLKAQNNSLFSECSISLPAVSPHTVNKIFAITIL